MVLVGHIAWNRDWRLSSGEALTRISDRMCEQIVEVPAPRVIAEVPFLRFWKNR